MHFSFCYSIIDLNYLCLKFVEENFMAKTTQDKLNKTLKFITNFVNEFGYPPTVREICKELDVSSSATAHYYLDKLEQQGLIKRSSTKNRAIEVVGIKKQIVNPSEITYAPLLGTVAAGIPMLATENLEENLCLPKSMFNYDELFATTVCGESMINAGIYNGDKIIVKKQNFARNGEIVVALIDDSVTVKRFYKEDDHIRLQPENDFMEPIIVDDCTILGTVIGLLRRF